MSFRKTTSAAAWRMEGRYETRVRAAGHKVFATEWASNLGGKGGVERLPLRGELLKRETDSLDA